MEYKNGTPLIGNAITKFIEEKIGDPKFSVLKNFPNDERKKLLNDGEGHGWLVENCQYEIQWGELTASISVKEELDIWLNVIDPGWDIWVDAHRWTANHRISSDWMDSRDNIEDAVDFAMNLLTRKQKEKEFFSTVKV